MEFFKKAQILAFRLSNWIYELYLKKKANVLLNKPNDKSLMNSFIFKRQPYTFNSWKGATLTKKDKYRDLIKDAYRIYNTEVILSDELYGTVYHFYSKNLNIDADNLSKPLWDSLTGFLFIDDFQVKIRIAGSFDLSKNDFNLLDFSGLPGKIITDLLDAFDNEEHVVYVECGLLNYSMFKFNIEKNGN